MEDLPQTDAHGAVITTEEDPPRSVALTVAANDRLLKALIAILALHDEGLMKELRTLFALAAREDALIGEATEATWDRIGGELKALRGFLATESPPERFDA